MTKNSKKIMSTAALVLLLVVTSGVIAFTYSRYTSGATGSVGVTIAAWKVKVNTADITANNKYRFDVMAKGTLEGNTVTTAVIKSAYVEVSDRATTTVVGYKNRIILIFSLAEILS